jgi:glycosyltransferase involved in cell wall biosynthesis
MYVPHGIDTSVFTPRLDRDEIREKAGVTGKFVIGIFAANKDAIRKCFFEQFEAFARFRRRHCSEAVLMVHTLATSNGAPDLRAMAEECGISDAIRFSHQYKTLMGLVSPAELAEWLSGIDVLSNTALGEGFGLTPLEAMACGRPAIVNDCSAMTELALSDEWVVRNQPFWNPTHNVRWAIPFIDDIVNAYCLAYQRLSNAADAALIQKAAREKAFAYDANVVTETFWRPTIETILERVGSRKMAL